MARPEHAAEIAEDLLPELLGFLIPCRLVQGDREIGLADQGVGVIRAKCLPQPRDGRALQLLALGEIPGVAEAVGQVDRAGEGQRVVVAEPTRISRRVSSISAARLG